MTTLAVSVERLNMPLNVMAVVHDKSTWVRAGVTVHNSTIDPGFRGYVTLELSLKPVRWWQLTKRIPAGVGIAQLVFHHTDRVCEPYAGKYQDQPPRPVPAIMEDL